MLPALTVLAAHACCSPAVIAPPKRMPPLTLAQYDQVSAEVNGTLNVTRLQQWMTVTNANTHSFLLWDTDGHQYLDMVRFLDASADFAVNGQLLRVWVTLIPPSESIPVGPSPPPRPPGCVRCPASHPHPYGVRSGGGFCCPRPSPDREHCPGEDECCLSPISGATGCEGVRRCGVNPTNKTVCPPAPAAQPSAEVADAVERCSVVADSPLTDFNETAMVDRAKGYMGCNDYVGWARILSKLATKYPQLVAVNIDDFSSNVPRVFNEISVAEIHKSLAGNLALIPTHYYGSKHEFVLRQHPWLAGATDGVLFYFRNDKKGQQQCGQPSAAHGGLCTPPTASASAMAAADADATPCTSCCLSGVRAELSLPNIDDEIADFARALPASHSLHIGIYFSGYSHCATPSPTYDRQALMRALSNPAVRGATIYTTEVPAGGGGGAEGCEGVTAATDKGCIVADVFENFTKSKP
jgi:hypothetical protein